MSQLITYKITGDVDGKLKQAARSACNFWNYFLTPAAPIILRVGVFKRNDNTIAESYRPHKYRGSLYGEVNFNVKYLGQFTPDQIAGTLIHEIGHTLGFGWDLWKTLFHPKTGKFTAKSVEALPALANMLVETEYGEGTQYAHWDEATFTTELMTGFKDPVETVLPVTISVMRLLGNQVNHELAHETKLKSLMRECDEIPFKLQSQAKQLDLDHYELTEIWEKIPHGPKRVSH
jgi:hypothetical protein